MPWVSRAVWEELARERAWLREQVVLLTRRVAEARETTADADRRAVRLSREEVEGVAFPEEIVKACQYYAGGDTLEEAASLEAAREWLDQGVPAHEVVWRIARGAGEMGVAS